MEISCGSQFYMISPVLCTLFQLLRINSLSQKKKKILNLSSFEYIYSIITKFFPKEIFFLLLRVLYIKQQRYASLLILQPKTCMCMSTLRLTHFSTKIPNQSIMMIIAIISQQYLQAFSIRSLFAVVVSIPPYVLTCEYIYIWLMFIDGLTQPVTYRVEQTMR